MSTFGPKFLESQFSLSASEAATLFGKQAMVLQCFPIFAYKTKQLVQNGDKHPLQFTHRAVTVFCDWTGPFPVGPSACQGIVKAIPEELCRCCGHLLPLGGRKSNCILFLLVHYQKTLSERFL